MDTPRRQRTIDVPSSVTGFGYWSGRDVCVEFRPAEAGTGIVFVRRDLPGCPQIPARIAHRLDQPRRTSLRCGSAGVDMIEHVMAALGGLQIDNCEVWVDAAEMPGCDGSALPFVEALDRAHIVEQPALHARCVVRDVIRLVEGEAWIEARPAAHGRTTFRYHLDYGPESPIGRQIYETAVTPEIFRRELAPCRTFMLKAEAEWLLAQGIGLRTRPQDLLVYDRCGPIDNHERFRDECVRHKLMDMLGDLALTGCDVVGEFTAHRSGHRLNAELVRALIEQAETAPCWKRCA